MFNTRFYNILDSLIKLKFDPFVVDPKNKTSVFFQLTEHENEHNLNDANEWIKLVSYQQFIYEKFNIIFY